MTGSVQRSEDERAGYAAHLAELARQAMVAEAELTPKPGLVDRRGSGSHCDLSLTQMRLSAASIAPYFVRMAQIAERRQVDQRLREQLAAVGRNAEKAMLHATGGSNAHKGAIWTLGLLLSAHSMQGLRDAQAIGSVAAVIARQPVRLSPRVVSHGQTALDKYGAKGAYGEACAGFPHAIQVGLPALRLARAEGRTETVSRLCALLQIAAQLEDTCVLYRGGRDGLLRVQLGAREVMRLGGPDSRMGEAAMRTLEMELISRRLSPGGSADLLAATLLLDAIDGGRCDVTADDSTWEETHGTHGV